MKTDLNVEFEARLTGEHQRMIIRWIAETARWVDPAIADAVPIVYPKTRRKRGEEKRGYRADEDLAVWRNEPAASACYRALNVAVNGATPKNVTGGRVCHIYGSSPVLPDHFTRLANLILVPKALESFTEWEPVRNVLKYRAWELYGYAGPSLDSPHRPASYPAWPVSPELEPGIRTRVMHDLTVRREKYPYYHRRVPTRRDDVDDEKPEVEWGRAVCGATREGRGCSPSGPAPCPASAACCLRVACSACCTPSRRWP